jgi:transposase
MRISSSEPASWRGVKGYVTNLDHQLAPGQDVIDANHDLYQVERSFRMTKSDLRARPVFHPQREAIEAHLTVVFSALAIARYLQAATDTSIKKVVNTLRPLRTIQIDVGGHLITAEPTTTPAARDILDRPPAINPRGTKPV